MDGLNALFTLIQQFRTLEYAQVSLHIIFLYDYIHLFPREVKCIWERKWERRCMGSILYLICRYTTFFTLGTVLYSINAPPDKWCLGLGLSSSWVTFVGIACAQLAFFLRAYALWNASRVIMVFLIVLATGMIGAGIVINFLIMRSTELLQPPINDPRIIPNCFLIVQGQPELAMWGVLSVLIVDSILMFLAIGSKLKLKYSLDPDTLARKVYKDSVFYFVLNFLISIVSIILYHKPQGPLKQLSGIFSAIMYRCLSCHIILRLREQSNQGLMTTITEINSLGPLEFRRNWGGNTEEEEEDVSSG